ncbi:MAG: hypothetical protein QM723_40495 [Myxococcaceae bacterium]
MNTVTGTVSSSCWVSTGGRFELREEVLKRLHVEGGMTEPPVFGDRVDSQTPGGDRVGELDVAPYQPLLVGDQLGNPQQRLGEPVAGARTGAGAAAEHVGLRARDPDVDVMLAPQHPDACAVTGVAVRPLTSARGLADHRLHQPRLVLAVVAGKAIVLVAWHAVGPGGGDHVAGVHTGDLKQLRTPRHPPRCAPGIARPGAGQLALGDQPIEVGLLEADLAALARAGLQPARLLLCGEQRVDAGQPLAGRHLRPVVERAQLDGQLLDVVRGSPRVARVTGGQGAPGHHLIDQILAVAPAGGGALHLLAQLVAVLKPGERLDDPALALVALVHQLQKAIGAERHVPRRLCSGEQHLRGEVCLGLRRRPLEKAGEGLTAGLQLRRPPVCVGGLREVEPGARHRGAQRPQREDRGVDHHQPHRGLHRRAGLRVEHRQLQVRGLSRAKGAVCVRAVGARLNLQPTRPLDVDQPPVALRLGAAGPRHLHLEQPEAAIVGRQHQLAAAALHLELGHLDHLVFFHHRDPRQAIDRPAGLERERDRRALRVEGAIGAQADAVLLERHASLLLPRLAVVADLHLQRGALAELAAHHQPELRDAERPGARGLLAGSRGGCAQGHHGSFDRRAVGRGGQYPDARLHAGREHRELRHHFAVETGRGDGEGQGGALGVTTDLPHLRGEREGGAWRGARRRQLEAQGGAAFGVGVGGEVLKRGRDVAPGADGGGHLRLRDRLAEHVLAAQLDHHLVSEVVPAARGVQLDPKAREPVALDLHLHLRRGHLVVRHRGGRLPGAQQHVGAELEVGRGDPERARRHLGAEHLVPARVGHLEAHLGSGERPLIEVAQPQCLQVHHLARLVERLVALQQQLAARSEVDVEALQQWLVCARCERRDHQLVFALRPRGSGEVERGVSVGAADAVGERLVPAFPFERNGDLHALPRV